MSGMCQRCFYDLALPDGDLCDHCRRQQLVDVEETARVARELTAEHEQQVLAQDEAAAA